MSIDTGCPLDQKCEFRFLYHSRFNQYNLPIYQCYRCNIQKQYPIPKEIKNFYNEEYYRGKADYSYIDERESEKFYRYVWKDRLRLIEKNFPKGKSLRILEVGSSFGGFLNLAKEKGHTVQGLEISEYSCQEANRSGIPTKLGSILEVEFPTRSFDLIIMIEVIEHIERPDLALDKIGNWLDEGGLFLVQTANFEGAQSKDLGPDYHYYLPGHLYYFGEANLKKALQARNFVRFSTFYGSDVSLLAKLKKMRGNFKKLSDYLKWIKTSIYHFKSKIKIQGIPLTSGFVLYAFKSPKDRDKVE
jgi:2-polyprenyl-3-methyl-5-hydroxy-6-metoxy-1,4-benzoquinol methylase